MELLTGFVIALLVIAVVVGAYFLYKHFYPTDGGGGGGGQPGGIDFNPKTAGWKPFFLEPVPQSGEIHLYTDGTTVAAETSEASIAAHIAGKGGMIWYISADPKTLVTSKASTGVSVISGGIAYMLNVTATGVSLVAPSATPPAFTIEAGTGCPPKTGCYQLKCGSTYLACKADNSIDVTTTSSPATTFFLIPGT
jgi:hypothetical protein